MRDQKLIREPLMTEIITVPRESHWSPSASRNQWNQGKQWL